MTHRHAFSPFPPILVFSLSTHTFAMATTSVCCPYSRAFSYSFTFQMHCNNSYIVWIHALFFKKKKKITHTHIYWHFWSETLIVHTYILMAPTIANMHVTTSERTDAHANTIAFKPYTNLQTIAQQSAVVRTAKNGYRSLRRQRRRHTKIQERLTGNGSTNL